MQAQIRQMVDIPRMTEEKEALSSGDVRLIELKPSETYSEMSPADCHFRLAESQFFRMCGAHAARYKVSEVSYIVNPALLNATRPALKRSALSMAASHNSV